MRNFIPSFSWGGGSMGFTTFEIDKAINVAIAMYNRRDMEAE